MNQKQAMLNVLLRHLSQPATLADHLDMLVALLTTATAEKTDAEQRYDIARDVFGHFVELCADNWQCTYDEALSRCGDEFEARRQFHGEGDTLKTIPYPEYLQSRHWQGVRQYALLRADNRCQLCNSSGPLDVHHRTYQRRGVEDYRDVIALCRDCHAKYHDKNK